MSQGPFVWLRRLLVPMLLVAQALLQTASAGWTPLLTPGQSSMPLSGYPEKIAQASAARILAVTTKGQPGIVFVNPDTGTLLNRVDLSVKPRAVTINAAGTLAYVLSDDSGTVTVVDVAAAKISTTWSVGGSLSSLALRADNSELIVADEAGNRIVGINPVTGAAARQLALSFQPGQLLLAQNDQRLVVGGKQGAMQVLDAGSWTTLSQSVIADEIRSLAWWPTNGMVLVLQKNKDGVSFFNLTTGAVSSQLGLDGDPLQIAVGSPQDKGYVATLNDFSINRLDLPKQISEGRYSLPSSAGGLVFDPATQNIYVTQPKDGAVLRLDPLQSPLVSTLSLNKRLKDIDVDNRAHRLVAIAEKTSEVVVMGLADKSTTTINIGARPSVLALDASRNLALIGAKADKYRLLFMDLGTNTLYPEKIDGEIRAIAADEAHGLAVALSQPKGTVLFVDTTARKLLGTLKLTGEYSDVAIHSAKGLAYLVSEDKRLTIIDVQNRTVVNTLAFAFKPERIAVDEKLNLAVMVTDEGDQAQVLDLNTLQVVQSYALPKHPDAVTLQLDTHVAAIASQESGQISLIDLQSGTLTSGFAKLEKPFAVTASIRYNTVYALGAEGDNINQIPLPNPLPVLANITPAETLLGSAAFVLDITGEHFVDSSQVYFGDQALTTRWLAPDKLEADVPAGMLTAGRAVAVTVQTPAPGGGTSQSKTFNVLNPAPVANSVAPASLNANKKDQSIAVTGAKFVPGAQVYFGAQPLVTSFVSSGQLAAVVPGSLLANSGTLALTVVNPAPGGGVSAPLTIQIIGAIPTVTGFSPATGPTGSIVTITGTNFDAVNPGANQVRFNGSNAVVASASSTQLTAVVPMRATSGPISVTTQGGTATSANSFTVQIQQDFDIALTPATLQIPLSGTGSTRIALSSTGLMPYRQTVSLSVTGLPAGVTYSVDRASLYMGKDIYLTFSANGTTAPGVYNVSVVGTGPVDLQTLARSKQLSITVLGAATTTVTGRVLHAEDDSPFVNARIRLGGQETFTDATGYYRFVNPAVAGDQVLLIDGHTNATDKWNYPSAIAMPVMIQAGKDNVALNSYIQAVDTSKFTTIVPAAETHVTVPDIPNYELRIPAGAVLMGWDGTPVTKVNVRTVPVDKLPIKPLPPEVNAKTVYLYYFFREGGATPSRPIPVTMNNDIDALPGEKVDLWYYDESVTPDPNSNQWRIMGKGTVSQDGKAIVSDPGVGIPKFCCGATTASNPAPPPPPPTCPMSGNPVSLASGAATVLDSKPFGIQGGKFPVNLSCGYSSVNPVVGFFGRGTYFNYDWRAVRSGTSAITVTAPNGERYNLVLEGDGVYRAREGRANGIGMEATISASGVVLRRQDGTVYEFSSQGLLIAQQDTSKNRIAIARDTNNYATSITDANGRVYNFDRAVIQIGRTRYTLVTKVTDPLGRTQSYGYDTQARLTSVTDAAGQVTLYEYDADSRIVKKTNVRGAVTQYVYDGAGRAIQEILPDGAIFKFDYVVAGNIVTETRVTDPNGNVTTHRFNGQGYETRTIDALGTLTSKEVDYTTNLVMSETDPAGRTTRYTYDGHGNLTSAVDVEGNTTIIEYDQQWNKPIRVTNAMGFISVLQYDGSGKLIKLINPEGGSTVFTYTFGGKINSVIDALGNTITLGYDEQDNLIHVTGPSGNTAQSRYDLANRLVEEINPRGRSQFFNYDVLDRVTQVIDSLGGKTQFTFDAKDNLLGVVDANNHPIETNVYDLKNRLTQRTDATGKTETYKYDGNGNIVQKTDRKGNLTGYQYDGLNRLTQITDGDGRTTQYGYDLAGNLDRISDSATGDILLAYDRLNRLTQVTTGQGIVSYAYDALGRRTQRLINGGDPTTYAYDKADRLTGISYRGKTVSYAYDLAGRLSGKTLPNGIRATYQYGAASRLISLTYAKADGTVIDSTAYTYDENGNRLSQSRDGIADTPFTATYDAANRMLSYNGFPLSYDAHGNLTQRQTALGPVTYTWDARNRLTQISGPNGTASFKYDALGRRLEKTVNGQTVQYLYDGTQAIAELQGSSIGTTYLTGLQIDEVLGRHSSSGNRALLTDALGSVIAQTDEMGAVQTQYQYSPYGEAVTLGADDGNPAQYTARENDSTGLYYYRARYYDPHLKRFISEDPIGLNGGVNVYAYVNNNPINLRDPYGLTPSCVSTILGVSSKEWDEISEKIITQFSMPVPIPTGGGVGPNLDPRKPRQPAIGPEINFEMWEVEYTLANQEIFHITQVIQHLYVMCTETRNEGCSTRTYNFEFNMDKPLDPVKTLVDTRMDWRWRKIRKLFSASAGF